MATILTHDERGISTLTLNRPERRNALTPEMQEELIEALDEAAESSSIRVLVLTGAGDAFCAGLDLAALQATRGKSALELADDAHRIARIFRTLYELPIPTIAAVNGHAIAGGAGLATVCDFTLAVSAARFRLHRGKDRLPPRPGLRLPEPADRRHASPRSAAHRPAPLRRRGARRRARQRVHAREALLLRVHTLAQTLIANSPGSLRATRALLAAQHRPWLDHAIDAALKANTAIRNTADFHEGVAAFLEKRKPVWSA